MYIYACIQVKYTCFVHVCIIHTFNMCMYIHITSTYHEYIHIYTYKCLYIYILYIFSIQTYCKYLHRYTKYHV